MTSAEIAAMQADALAGTPGEWCYRAMGGSSTVTAAAKPARNDNRIPAYGYTEENSHCVAYPFIEDDGRIRLDFVCFSHDDARRIARVPRLEAAVTAQAAEIARLGGALAKIVSEFGGSPNGHRAAVIAIAALEAGK